MCGDKAGGTPVAIEIHPTSKCNYRCIHCSYEERNEKRVSLPQVIMDALISSVIKMGIHAVCFSGGGEPTVYPNLVDYVKRLYENNVEVSLLTNGSLLESMGFIEIADMFNYIAISMPSVDFDNYQYITKSKDMETVLEIAEKIKARHKEKSPVVGTRVVLTNRNYGEIPEFINTLKNRRFDYTLFKVVRDYEDRGLGLGGTEEKTLKEIVSEIAIDSKFTNLHKIFEHKAFAFSANRCLTNEMGLIANVDSDGKVYPNIVEIGDEAFCIGDLNHSPLEDMWNGAQHSAVKRASNQKWISQKCKNCRAIAYNNIMQEMIDRLPAEIDYFI